MTRVLAAWEIHMVRRAMIVGLVAGVGMLGGCTEIVRTGGGLLGQEGAKAEYGVVWNTAIPEMLPPSASRKSVYVTYQDVSGEEISLHQELREAIASRGYVLTGEPDQAAYRVRATLRYFGPNDESTRTHIDGILNGVVAGTAVGAATYGVLGASGAGDGAAMVGGGATGLITGIAIENRSRSKTWNMILDLALDEYRGSVETTQELGSKKREESGMASHTGGGIVLGRDERTGALTQRHEEQRTHLQHGARMTAWARQWSMSREEAKAVLVPRIRSGLAQVLPPVS